MNLPTLPTQGPMREDLSSTGRLPMVGGRDLGEALGADAWRR